MKSRMRAWVIENEGARALALALGRARGPVPGAVLLDAGALPVRAVRGGRARRASRRSDGKGRLRSALAAKRAGRKGLGSAWR